MTKLKTACVYFENPKYNYKTAVNGALSDERIISMFTGKTFNLGGIRYVNGIETEVDDLQICIKCTVQPFIYD